ASLHRDVLQARAGLLRNYDNLGSSLEAMERAVVQLRSYAESQGIDTKPVERLAATVAQQEELTEHFKTSNALFQNSISYVGQLSRDSAFGAKDAEFARATGALAAAILRLLHDTSLDSVSGLGERIDQLDEQVSRVGLDAEPTRGLLAHARLLREVLPTVDAALRSLIAVPSREPLEATRALFGYHQAAVETTARRYRMLLYLASLFLLVALVRLGLQLRARARVLRQRATFERIIAETSTSLINCPTEETTARLHEVLAKLGRAIGVERAYVVLEGGAARVHAWCAEGTTCRPGWPAQALALFEELGHPGPDILTVPQVTTLRPGAAKKTLEAAGVRGWACVPLTRPGRIRGVMGFDTAAPAWDKVFPLPVLRLAGDAVINAIEREFLERDRATLAARLERARRMQMIGSLASGIAHNFNNIIGAILGYSEMIEPQLAPGTEPAQHVDEIRRAAERGRDLIDHILTFGRRGEARMQRVGMPTLFEEAGSLLCASLPASAQLIIADVAADVAVVGEPSELQQVILNLCTNAAQAMEGGGVIRVAAERRDITAPLVLTHGELRAGRYVCLSVSDNGRGFDDGVSRRLFEPFFTTRRAGTGLGLATVQEIVRDHDGAMN